MTTNCPFCNTTVSFLEVASTNNSETKIECTNPKCGQIFSFHHTDSIKSTVNLIEKVEADAITGKLVLQGNTISLIPHFDLTENNTIIGRGIEDKISGKARISINTEDTTMSRLQCEIRIIRDKFTDIVSYTLKDLGSLNGTLLNGEKLIKEEEVYLQDNDILKLGNIAYKFEQK